MLRLLERNGVLTDAEGNCFVSELQSKRKHVTVWIKIQEDGIQAPQTKIQKTHNGRWEAGLDAHDGYDCGSGWLAQSSQGKPENTAALVTTDRQRNHLKHLAKDFQIT